MPTPSRPAIPAVAKTPRPGAVEPALEGLDLLDAPPAGAPAWKPAGAPPSLSLEPFLEDDEPAATPPPSSPTPSPGTLQAARPGSAPRLPVASSETTNVPGLQLIARTPPPGAPVDAELAPLPGWDEPPPAPPPGGVASPAERQKALSHTLFDDEWDPSRELADLLAPGPGASGEAAGGAAAEPRAAPAPQPAVEPRWKTRRRLEASSRRSIAIAAAAVVLATAGIFAVRAALHWRASRPPVQMAASTGGRAAQEAPPQEAAPAAQPASPPLAVAAAPEPAPAPPASAEPAQTGSPPQPAAADAGPSPAPAAEPAPPPAAQPAPPPPSIAAAAPLPQAGAAPAADTGERARTRSSSHKVAEPSRARPKRERVRKQAAAPARVKTAESRAAGKPAELRASGKQAPVAAQGSAGSPARAPPVIAFPDSVAPGVDSRFLFRQGLRIRFAWRPVRGARGYRIQIARDISFQAVEAVADVPGPAHDFAPRGAGLHVWRVAARDARGELGEYGFARRLFCEKTEPRDFLVGPTDGSTVHFADRPPKIGFWWESAGAARRYRLVVARGPDLRRDPVVSKVTGDQHVESELPPGHYLWGVYVLDAGDEMPIFVRPRLLTVRRNVAQAEPAGERGR